jgi:hypothetical protein
MKSWVAALLAAVILIGSPSDSAAALPTPTNCQDDVNGANDDPGQRDVTRKCIDVGDGSPYEYVVSANWDETTLTGNNTADVCVLFDSDLDGFAGYAVCVTLESGVGNLAVFQSLRLFSCNDDRPDRCTNSVLVPGPYVTNCEVSQQPTDPFGPASPNGPGAEYPYDTVIVCGIDLGDFGAEHEAAYLVDACSYPSTVPNSAPGDCVAFADCSTSADCDDGNPCTTDSCSQINTCQHTVTPGEVCSDDLYCNGDEICNSQGGCVANTPRNCDDSLACTIDSCDELDDSCINSPSNSLCTNGQYCDGIEVCDPQSGAPPDGCVDGSDPCPIGVTCNETSDLCEGCQNDGDCDNGLYCDGVETCNVGTGVCQPGTPPDCTDSLFCTVDACDEETDSCTHAGLNCADSVACTIDSCDESADSCIHSPSDSLCANGQYCDGIEVCNAQSGCQPGTPPDCSDAFFCTVDACDEATDSCTHTVVNCADSVACTIDSCDEITDSCIHSPSDSLCANGLYCDGIEICNAQSGCQSGTPPDCSDSFFCTVDACDEETDSCTHEESNSLCDNGQYCDGIEICNAQSGCQPGSGDPCPLNTTCNETSDECEECQNDGDCDNGLYCDGAEACVGGVCQSGTPPDCSDSLFCTVDACDEETDSCTYAERNCADSVACTIDSCDESADSCIHSPSNSLCANGQYCDGVEICNAQSGCQPGTPPDCSDSFFCTVDACDEATDSCTHTVVNCADSVACTIDSCDEITNSCIHSPSDSLCANGLYCDGIEICNAQSGCQSGTPPDCADSVACTVEACDEGSDSCTHTPDDAACSDGLFCNGAEKCNAQLGCEAGAIPDCSHPNPCYTSSCDEPTKQCKFELEDPSCLCGDGHIDDGEECDPPTTAGTFEDCNNLIDDDGDGKIDCRDNDCAPGQRDELCDEGCTYDRVCEKFIKDPGLIKYGWRTGTHDRLVLHGRFLLQNDRLIPMRGGFTFEMSNEDGVFYRIFLGETEFKVNRRGTAFVFLDKSSRHLGDSSPSDGVYKVVLKQRSYSGVPYVSFRIVAYGDFGGATHAEMTTQLAAGGSTGGLTAEWSARYGAWTLDSRDF